MSLLDPLQPALRIFLVEDDADISSVVALALASDQRMVCTMASNGMDAVDHARVEPNPYDLLLVNVMLPDISGVDLLALLKTFASTKAAKTVFMTALVTPAHLGMYDRAEADAIIVKPFDAVALASTLRGIHGGALSGVIQPR